MALTKRRAKMALAGYMAISGFTGCCGDSLMARKDASPGDALVRAEEPRPLKPDIGYGAMVARSQAPEVLPPVKLGQPQTAPGRAMIADGQTIPPGRATVGDPVNMGKPYVVPPLTTEPSAINPAPVPVVKASGSVAVPSAGLADEGDTQVRIVASIGNNPIYESEVREAVYQRLGELLKLGDRERAVKQKEIFKEELRRIIERELVLEDMTSTLTSRKQTSALGKLKEAAGKEADAMVKTFKKDRGVTADEEFKAILRAQGLTLSGIRRQIERGTMMRIYMQEKVSARMDSIGLGDIREYYEAHGNDFMAEDNVQWMDLFVMKEKFAAPAESKKYAEGLLAQLKNGSDFGTTAAKSGHGDSALRNGAGIGEKPGEIFPPELEPAVFRLKSGQIAIEETETGYHIIKIIDRTVAGRRPLDEKLQAEVKRKVQAQIFEREAKRYVDTLWKRSQPQVWVDL